jgi:hypothetical protein
VCGSWNFESGGIEKFQLASTSTASDGALRAVSGKGYNSTYALEIPFNGDGTLSDVLDVKITLCPFGAGEPLSNRTLKMNLLAQPASGQPSFNAQEAAHYIMAYNGSESVYGGCDSYQGGSGTWYEWECSSSQFPSGEITDIIFRFRVSKTGGWRGKFYLDNVRLE